MDPKRRFSYSSLGDLRKAMADRGCEMPSSEDVSILGQSVAYGRLTVPNRLVCQPMEGCDCEADGSPGELTLRKYRRLAAGGAGMIWWEACAIVPEAKANPRQLSLHKGNVKAFAAMVRAVKDAAMQSVGYEPICVLQMTHSGRYSRPTAGPEPIIAHRSAVLDGAHGLGADYPLITDEELDELQNAYVAQAILAAEAGFDAVDVKSCHRYLLSELLASFTRQESRYGGSYANRTRMLRETSERVQKALSGAIEVTCRLNVYDAIEYPYGWGVDKIDANKPDLAEPIRLIGELREAGYGGVNVTIGNPYWNPYVNRPADWMISDWPDPPEDPITGLIRIIEVVRDIQKAHPDFTIIGSGYSWLRQYVAQFGAGLVRDGWTTMVGLGRGALAYPDFAKDILESGRMDPHKVCVACSSCTQIMRDGGQSGCVVRDPEIYAPIFKAGRKKDFATLQQLARQCRQCPDAMCVTRCPAGVDIPGFLGALAEGDEAKAYRILVASNVLPEICGTVCPVEVQCQAGCIRNYLADGPVPIGEIQRYLSERAIAAGWAAIDIPDTCSQRRVAVIGAGPAGISAAAELLRLGHCVTVFEARKRLGGKLDGVIPTSRLSVARVQAEIDALFDSVPADRISWRLGESLTSKLTLDDVLAEGFDAAVLAMGLGGHVSLADKGAPASHGVIDAGDFLRQMNANPTHACGPRVAVIGGGNTAMDAASMAAQRGADDVFLVYRRSYKQMPAWPGERDAALRAGVHFMLLCQPKRYVINQAGQVNGVEVLRTELGEPDASGRRSPAGAPGSEYVLPVDLVIEAIGETPGPGLAETLSGVDMADGLVSVDADTLATSRPGVYAAGDMVNGGATVVRAVAQGRIAGGQASVFLSSLSPESTKKL